MANLGLQNNNPGNLKDPVTGSFRTFGSVDEGNQALMDDLKVKQTGGSQHIKPGASLSQLASVWAPSSDNNNPDNYANTLATHLGVSKDTAFDKVPTDKLAEAIKVAEGTSTPSTTSSTQKMSMKDFAQKIRDKYKAYQGVDDNTLVTKFLAKYPVYQDRVDTTPSHSPETEQHVKDMVDQGKSHEDVQAYLQSVKAGTPAPAGSETTPVQPDFNYGSEVGKQFAEGGQHIVSSIEGGAKKLQEGAEQSNRPGIGNFLEGTTKIAEGGAQSFLGTVAGGLQTVFSPITPAIGKVFSDFANAHPTIAGAVGNAIKPIDDIAQKHPEEAGVIGDAITALLSAVGEKFGGDKLSVDSKPSLPSFLSKADKTAEEIASVPEGEVSKLTSSEQKEWYRQKSQSLTNDAKAATEKAQQAGVESNKQAVDEIQNFSTNLAETSRDEASALKPKAQELMKTSSQHYVELTGEAADGSPALSKTISHDDLASKIDSKFEYNPEIGASLKQDLGLSSTVEQPPEKDWFGDSVETPSAKSKTLTNQEILDKARSIMQDVSKTAKAGNKVYTPEEYQAMQKYSFLMETLGDNGVDMAEANKFWKQWAPVRDRIVREIKPFDTESIGKTPFESTLKKAGASTGTANQIASKLDAQNFISELETRMKLPKGTIGKETQDLVSQLEKAKLNKKAIKEITDEALSKIKADKAEAIKEMGLQKYNSLSAVDKAARNKAIIKKIIIGVLGLGVANTKTGRAVIHAAVGGL